MPRDYAWQSFSYGYRHELPVLTEEEWRRGLRWRWATEDINVGDGEGIMACYLAKIGWRQWAVRLLFGSYAEYCAANKPIQLRPEPAVEQEFRYPPGLDLDAFFFRLDLKGNPRDVGFEWAWMRPLLPVQANPAPVVAAGSVFDYMDTDEEWHERRRPRPPAPQPGIVCRSSDVDELAGARDVEWQEYLDSEYVELAEFRAVKRGDLPTLRERLQTFDDRYQRPVCRCGQSHPELHTPMRQITPERHDRHYKGSFYKCNGCKRKWQSSNLKAALELKPLVKSVRLRKAAVPQEDVLPDALLKPPAVD